MINTEAPPFIDPRQTIQDLENAVEYLITHGWAQGYDFDGKGNVCAFGAIRGVTGDDNPQFVSEQTRDRCSNAGRAFYRFMGQDIVTWNDMEGRTKHEVIRALETVANALKEDPRRA
jgi:hypothetical protein